MLRSLLLRASAQRRFSLAIPPSLSLHRSSSSSRPSGFTNGTFVEQLEDANATPPPAAKISVDRSGLYNVPGNCLSLLFHFFGFNRLRTAIFVEFGCA